MQTDASDREFSPGIQVSRTLLNALVSVIDGIRPLRVGQPGTAHEVI